MTEPSPSILDQQKAATAAQERARKIVKAETPIERWWVIRYMQETPVGWLYFSPGNGLPDPDERDVELGKVTDWHNDHNKALPFQSEEEAECLHDFLKRHADDWPDRVGTEVVECIRHPWHVGLIHPER